MEEADLLSIGQHCDDPGCHRLDFLPFKCDKCQKTFCVDHRTEKQHNCVNQEIGNTQIPQCPLCLQYIRRGQKQSANDQVEAHILSGCKDLVVEVKKKHPNRCSYKSCRRYELVPIVCPSCNKTYCIKHRLESDHQCPAPLPPHANASGNIPMIRVKS